MDLEFIITIPPADAHMSEGEGKKGGENWTWSNLDEDGIIGFSIFDACEMRQFRLSIDFGRTEVRQIFDRCSIDFG